MAAAVIVKNGEVIGPVDPESIVKCDRCGRPFPARHIYCVCRG